MARPMGHLSHSSVPDSEAIGCLEEDFRACFHWGWHESVYLHMITLHEIFFSSSKWRSHLVEDLSHPGSPSSSQLSAWVTWPFWEPPSPDNTALIIAYTSWLCCLCNGENVKWGFLQCCRSQDVMGWWGLSRRPICPGYVDLQQPGLTTLKDWEE